MRYISILYIFFLSLLAGGNLQSILKEADKICTVYDFDAGTVLSNDKAFANIGQRKKVAEELSAKGFPYDAQNDTLVLRIQCTDYLVGTYRSTFGRTSYYPLPVSIDAYSTKGECHLKLRDSEYEVANPSADLLVPLIKANDIAAIADLHKKYGADASGAVPDNYIVIIIQGGKAISASRWSLMQVCPARTKILQNGPGQRISDLARTKNGQNGPGQRKPALREDQKPGMRGSQAWNEGRGAEMMWK